MKISVTTEDRERNYSYALAQATGQKSKGSGDPANEFEILTESNGDGTFTVTIPDGKITQAEFAAIIANPEQEDLPSEIYKEQRRAAYLPNEDQLDMLWHDMENGTTNWRDHRREVKNKYPKAGE